MNVKEIREKAKYSQSAAAALAKCSPTTWRLYEAQPGAVRPGIRVCCDAAVAKLAAMLQEKTA